MTTKEITVRVLVPSEGMRLTNGETVAEGDVYLGIHDDPSNWREVTVEEAARIEAELDAKAEREAAEAKAKWEEEHKEEVEAKKAEEKAKAEAERDERETALVDKVIERRNAQLTAVADRASKGAK